MARFKKRFDEIDRALQEEEAKRHKLTMPTELSLIALVSPVTKKPVQYYDLHAGAFLTLADCIEGRA